jgi:Putative prokaryotic signal transducing protein
MKKLHTFNIGQNAQVGLLQELVEKAGIPCVTRNDHLSTASGAIPFTECYPELWILNDEDCPKARELLDRWLTPEDQGAGSWVCPNWGEKIEGQFTSCWKCGTLRENQG